MKIKIYILLVLAFGLNCSAEDTAEHYDRPNPGREVALPNVPPNPFLFFKSETKIIPRDNWAERCLAESRDLLALAVKDRRSIEQECAHYNASVQQYATSAHRVIHSFGECTPRKSSDRIAMQVMDLCFQLKSEDPSNFFEKWSAMNCEAKLEAASKVPATTYSMPANGTLLSWCGN